MVKTISCKEIRTKLGDILNLVKYGNDQIVIERAGKAMAVLIPMWQFEQWFADREKFFLNLGEEGKMARTDRGHQPKQRSRK